MQKKRLVFHNLRLAIKIAYQYNKSWSNLMDLVQESCMGMIVASNRWDPNKGTSFGTYSIYWMKAYINRFLMLNTRLIHSANTRIGRKLYFQLPIIKKRQENEKISLAIIAKQIHENPRDIAMALSNIQVMDNMEDNLVLKNYVAYLTPESEISFIYLIKYIRKAVKTFYFLISNKRDKYIWKHHIISKKPISLIDLGRKFCISKQRTSQLIKRLRAYFQQYLIKRIGYFYRDF
jgi:RNA polymerase sigma-32 factor